MSFQSPIICQKSIRIFATVLMFLCALSAILGAMYLGLEYYQVKYEKIQSYHNDQYGFELTLKDDWQGHKTVTDISTWKTYTDSAGAFSFKYPSDYTVDKENGFLEIKSPLTDKILRETGGESSDAIIVTPTMDHPEYILPSPVVFSAQYFSSQNVHNWNNSYIGPITIDNRTGFQFTHGEMVNEKYTLFQNSDGTYFAISSEIRSEGDSVNLEPYDTIISTFKFTK